MAKKKVARITIVPPAIGRVPITVVGDTSLICNRFDNKVVEALSGKHEGKATTGRKLKNPDEQVERSIHRLANGKCGFPAIAFKSAAVRAGKAINLVMADLKIAFHIFGEGENDLVELVGKYTRHTAPVRNDGGTLDIRHRAEFKKWSATFMVRFNEEALSVNELFNLFNRAGCLVGIGELRPSGKKGNGGNHGLFHVKAKGQT